MLSLESEAVMPESIRKHFILRPEGKAKGHQILNHISYDDDGDATAGAAAFALIAAAVAGRAPARRWMPSDN